MILYRLFKHFDNFIERLSSSLLVAGLMFILFFSVLSIVARWMQFSFHWIEPLVRHLVFICTFLGGVVATGKGSHIAIDILGKYLENKKAKGDDRSYRFVRALISLISSLTLIWLVFASLGFVKVELEYGRNVFWGIHSGFLVAIIPIGFGLIGIRFLFQFFAFAIGDYKLSNQAGFQND